jgi:surface polysaccharide O-acyltransferase-like enzyme
MIRYKFPTKCSTTVPDYNTEPILSYTAGVKSKVWFIEYLRIIAALGVVLIHTAADISFSYGQVAQLKWWSANLISSMTHWAVPIFIMVSGYLLLEQKKSKDKQKLYLSRLKRIGLPLFFWTATYAIYHHFTRQDPLSVSFVIKRLIFDQPYEHLYFLIVLLQLALITPFLAKITKHLSEESLGWLTLGLLLIGIFWKPWRFIVPLFIPYLGFYLGGFWLKKKKITLNNKLFITIVSLAITFICTGTYFLVSNSSPDRNGLYFYTYFNPFTILLSFSIFSFFQNLEKKLPHYKIILKISSTTLGIYLIHPMVMDLFEFIYIPNGLLPTMILLLLKGSLVFLVSALITAIYQRLKLAILRE